MAMLGFFDKQTPEHLLRKLEREYVRWKADPLNTDLAWNFFVTAEHVPEWQARTGPRLPKGFSYKKFTKDIPLLRICSHLASGARHFRPRADQHTSVASTRRREGWIEPGWVSEDWIEHEALMVDLTPAEQRKLRSASASIEALAFAADVLAFWQQRLGLPPRPPGKSRP
jgi:hypothetical protein